MLSQKNHFINSLIIFCCFITGMVTFTEISNASEQILLGQYKSLDGKIGHDFKASGDYEGGAIEGNGKLIPVAGVYKQGDDVCWLPSADGSHAHSGNLLIFYGEEECCLRFMEISNKLAVTFIWSKPYSIIGPHSVCQSQVLEKIPE